MIFLVTRNRVDFTPDCFLKISFSYKESPMTKNTCFNSNTKAKSTIAHAINTETHAANSIDDEPKLVTVNPLLHREDSDIFDQVIMGAK